MTEKIKANFEKQKMARRRYNVAENRRALRERLDGAEALNRIERLEQEILTMLSRTVETNMVDENGRMVLMPAKIDPARIAAIKVALDSCYKRLNKILPDARQEMDVTTGGERLGVSERKMTALEALNRLNWLRTQAQGEPIPIEQAPGLGFMQ